MIFVSPSMIKTYLKCPRILWFNVNTFIEAKTLPMILGKKVHRVIDLEAYRSKIGFTDYVKDVYLESRKYMIAGVLDYLALIDGKWIPVEYKHSTWIDIAEKAQTAAYALLAEDNYNVIIDYAYIVTPMRVLRLRITGKLRRITLNVIEEVKKLIESPTPPSIDPRPLCTACPYSMYCKI